MLSGLACRSDTPEAGIRRFWQGVAEGDADKILRSQVYYRPGMTSEYIWTIEDIEWLYLDSLQVEPRRPGRVVVYYQVVFKKRGQDKITRYSTGTMVIKKNDEWRVGAPVGSRKAPSGG